MTDPEKIDAVYELIGKLIYDAEGEISAVKRYRREMEGADMARVKDRAEMAAISMRIIARVGEKIDRIVKAILAAEPAAEEGEPLDDLGLCTQAGEGRAA